MAACRMQVLFYCTIVTVSGLVYINSLNGNLVFDDHRAIISNDDLNASKTSLEDLLLHDFWGGHMERVESHKSYRPLTVLTYRINFHFHDLEPYGYHAVNVCCHTLVCVLFLALCQVIISGSPVWPFLCSLLFAVHSVHTEAIASVVGRAEVLACIFFLGSVLSYMFSIGWTKPLFIPCARVKWHWIVVSILFAVCSLLCKEQGITALGVCIAFDVLLHWRPLLSKCGSRWWRAAEACSAKEGIPIDVCVCKVNDGGEGICKLGSLVARIGVMLGTGMSVVYWRLSMNYGTQPIFKPEELRASFHSDTLVRILSFNNIYCFNVWLLLSPYTLCCDWSLGSVPLVSEMADLRNLWSFLLYIVLIAFAVHILRQEKKYFEVGSGIVILIVPFLPSSGVLFKVGFVIAERVLYMPSLGFCILVTIGLKRLYHYRKSNILKCFVSLMAIFLLVVMSIRTVKRNEDWSTDFALFESGVKAIPRNVKILNNYAMELKSKGRKEEARRHYKMAMGIDPDYGEVYFNYGNLLSEEENHQEALAFFKKAAQYPQVYPKTLNNLATMHFKLGQNALAEKWFLESIRLNADQANVYSNLGSLYGMTNRPQQAEEMFKQAITISPAYVEGFFNLGTLLVQHSRPEEGEVYLRKALLLNPHHTGAANNLKVAIYDRSIKEQAATQAKSSHKNGKKKKKRTH